MDQGRANHLPFIYQSPAEPQVLRQVQGASQPGTILAYNVKERFELMISDAIPQPQILILRDRPGQVRKARRLFSRPEVVSHGGQNQRLQRIPSHVCGSLSSSSCQLVQ
jgi:hypothetical protein